MLEENQKKADNMLMPIYAATVLGLLKWEKTGDTYISEDIPDYSEYEDCYLHYEVSMGLFKVMQMDCTILSLPLGEIGKRLLNYFLEKEDKHELTTLRETLCLLKDMIEERKQNAQKDTETA